MKTANAFLVPAFLAILLAATYIPVQITGDTMAVKTAMLMGTIIEIKVPVSGSLARTAAEEKIERALEEVRRIEGAFSVYDTASEVSKINRLHKGDALKISAEVFDLIDRAKDLSVTTNGAFDITVKPLVDLWASAKATGKIPSAEAVKAALEKTGSRNIVLDRAAGTIAFAKEGMSVDLGGIAKGYAAGRAAKVLEKNGVNNAIVNCGGDMYCLGKKSAKEEWKVGIRHPRNKEDILMELRLKNKAVDTSGDYEKYFIAGGKRYSHIIDPRTGYPVGDDVVSASVIADDPVVADALATALCVLGRDGMNPLDADAIMVVARGGGLEIEMSRGVKDKYHVTQTR